MIQNIEHSFGKPASSHGSSSSSESSKSSGKGGDPGGSEKGSPSAPKGSSNASSSSDEHVDPYKHEKKTMRIKGYDSMKFPSIPKNAAEARGYRNSVYSAICKLSKKDETEVLDWTQHVTQQRLRPICHRVSFQCWTG